MSASPPPPPPPPPPGGWPPPLSGWSAPQGGPPPASWPVMPGAPPPPWGWAPQPVLPGSGRFRAQAVGELLDSAFTLYRRNVRLILALTAVVQVPLALFRYLALELTGYPDATSRLQRLGNSGTITRAQLDALSGPLITLLTVTFAVLLVQALIVQPIATAAMTRAVGDVYLEHPASVGGAYRAVGRRVGAVVGVSAILFAVGLGLVGATLAVVVLAILAIGGGGAALLLVIVPVAAFAAIVLYTRWLFAAPVVVLERLGPVAALRRSWHLVRGSTARVFGITLLVGLITGILSAVVTALLSIITQFGDASVRLILGELATLVVAVLIQPISFVVVVLLYYDLRIRREAFDIEMLAATL